jgi:AraC family transcriptional regulator of arabinose operon
MDKRIGEILDLLDREWRRDHPIEELASSVNLTASRLQHLFKSHMRRSITELLQARRLDEAATLLVTTHERVSAIAYFVGFRDVPNFNHAFRRRFHISPRQYRANTHESSRLASVAAESTRFEQDLQSENG